VRDITLAPLTRDDTAGIVRSMLGVDDVPQEFLDRVHVETAGNPFFIQEVMRALIENGTVYLDAGKWATHGSIGDLRIPASIADVFRRRFRRLDTDLQEAMRILSVQARPMRLELLAEALGGIHEAGRAALALVELGLATRSDGTDIAYRIAHDRMRETIYADMSEEARRDRHRLVGLALERVTTATRPDEPPLDELAHQLWHAGVLDKALPYALAAGERAMSRFENHAAAEHFDRAVQLLDPSDPRYDGVLERHADMLVRLTRYDAGLSRYHELLARHAGRPRDESRVHGKISDVHMQRSELELAVDYGWRALAVYGEKRPATRVGWLLMTCREFLVFAATRLGMRRPAGGPGDASAIVELYDNLFRPYFFLSPLRTFYCTLRIWRLGCAAPDLESRACGNSGIAMMIGIVGLRRWSMDLFQQARQEAEAAASRWWIGGVEMRRAAVQRMEGRWEVGPLDRATATLRDAGHLFDYGAAVFHAADAEYFIGNINGAFERMRRYNLATFRVSEGAPSSARGTLILETLCRALRMEHDIDSRFQQYYEYSLARRDIVVVAALLHRWGETLVMRDRLHDGLEKLERSYAMWRRHRLVDNYSAEVLYKLPRAYLRLERPDRDRTQLLHRVQGQAMRKTRRIHRNWRAPVLVNEALIAEARGQPHRADALVTEALEVARRQNAGLFVSDVLHEWARMLMKRGAREAARERMAEALAIADTGGNRWLAQRCRAALSFLES
jgi:tetratricopeptide (TPR) repeat protein